MTEVNCNDKQAEKVIKRKEEEAAYKDTKKMKDKKAANKAARDMEVEWAKEDISIGRDMGTNVTPTPQSNVESHETRELLLGRKTNTLRRSKR